MEINVLPKVFDELAQVIFRIGLEKVAETASSECTLAPTLGNCWDDAYEPPFRGSLQASNAAASVRLGPSTAQAALNSGISS